MDTVNRIHWLIA